MVKLTSGVLKLLYFAVHGGLLSPARLYKKTIKGDKTFLNKSMNFTCLCCLEAVNQQNVKQFAFYVVENE